MRTLIIDDEEPAVKVLTNFVMRTSFLKLERCTTNAFEGIELLNTNSIDLLFLDIEMPDINGVDLLKSLKNKPMVILTTAYEQYALQGYEMDVLDYLVKPIRYERFLKAANKAGHLFNLTKSNQPQSDQGKLLIKVDYKNVKINYSDIEYIEGLKDYVKIFTSKGMFMTRLNLKGIEGKLPATLFLRIHRSYIIAIKKISSYQKGQIFINNNAIPIGTTYSKALKEHLGD